MKYEIVNDLDVSIPFIAGQWSLHVARPTRRKAGGQVSIPFIAGQWSLHGACHGPMTGTPTVSIPFIAGQWSLLHSHLLYGRVIQNVSIPFIAGQWSLLLRTTPLSFCGVRLPNLRPACDHLLWACLHRWPKPAIIP